MFLFVVNLIILTPQFVHPFFDQVAAAMNIDMEVAVEFDDAFEDFLLFFDGGHVDGKFVFDLKVARCFEVAFMVHEGIYHFGVVHHLLGKFLQAELFMLFEVVDGAVEQVGLVGLAYLKFFRVFAGDKVFAETEVFVGLVVAVGPGVTCRKSVTQYCAS